MRLGDERMFDDYSDEPIYNVKAIAHQSGIMASTLRAWERRYGIPTPGRANSGYRLYSSRDIAIIRWLKAQIESGMSISQAVSLLRSIQVSSSRQTQPPVGTAVAAVPVSSEIGEQLRYMQEQLITFAMNYNEQAIEHTLSEAFALYPVEDVCTQLIQSTLIAIGEGWHRGEINISVEHFFSNLMRRKLLSLFAACPPPTSQVRIVSGCAPGEMHEMGILMISLFLRRRGHDVVFLGQSLGLERLGEMLQTVQPRMLLISAGSLVAASNLLTVTEVVHENAPNVIFAFGGHIFSVIPDLHLYIPGHRVSADAQLAIDELEALVEDPDNGKVKMVHHSRETREAYHAVRAQRAGLISQTVEHLGRMFDRDHLINLLTQLMSVVEATMHLGQPSLLDDVNAWNWDTRILSDGPRLKLVIRGLEGIVQGCLPQQAATIRPYLASMIHSLDVNKD